MNPKRILTALIAISILTLQTAALGAQNERAHKRLGGWAARANFDRTAPALARRGAVQDPAEQEAGEAGDEPLTLLKADAATESLVGTWVLHVPDAPGAPGFDALQTYNADGTMTETSSLLGQLPEGPAHGVWARAEKKGTYNVTFELFAFDETGQAVGRIRVRVLLRVIGKDNLTADTAVDFIEPGGNVISDIGGGPFSGTRVKLLPVQ